jgi:hypothetical protein
MRTHQPGQEVFRSIRPEDFHWARSGEYVTQVTAIGPLCRKYLNPEDDPRNNRASTPT